MRLVRIGALVGSVMLLAATTVSLLNHRSELRSQQDARVTAAAQVADQSVESVVLRGVAVVDAATAASDPSALIRSFGEGAAACIVDGDSEQCSGANVLTSAAFGEGASASVRRGGSAVVIDQSNDTLLIVQRTDVTVALEIPSASLISPLARSTIADYDATVTATLHDDRSVSPDVGVVRTGPASVDGERVVIDIVVLPGDGGSVMITATVDDAVGLGADGLAMYVVLFLLGAVLLGLAGWTFLLDRRSLERRATTDDLTGLPNRREFERLTEEALLVAERFGTGLCIMLIDLNGFKQINDTLGHQFGDLVLRASAERLAGSVREGDVVGRWGGDEFVILLPGVQDGTGVRSSAERIGGNLADTPIVGDVSVGAAIGAALYPRHGTSLDDLIRAADVAMYGAKSTGVTHRLADPFPLDAPDAEIRTPSGYRGPDRRAAPNADRHPV